MLFAVVQNVNIGMIKFFHNVIAQSQLKSPDVCCYYVQHLLFMPQESTQLLQTNDFCCKWTDGSCHETGDMFPQIPHNK